MKLTNISAPPLVLSLDYYYYYFYFISQTVRPFLYLLPSIYRFLSFSSGQIKKKNLILILVFAINLGRFLFLLNYLALVTLCTWYITSAMRVLFQLSYSNTSIWLTCIYIAMIYSHAHFDQSWNSMPPPPQIILAVMYWFVFHIECIFYFKEMKPVQFHQSAHANKKRGGRSNY